MTHSQLITITLNACHAIIIHMVPHLHRIDIPSMSSVSCFTKIHNMSTIKIAIHCTRVFATALHSDRKQPRTIPSGLDGRKKEGRGGEER